MNGLPSTRRIRTSTPDGLFKLTQLPHCYTYNPSLQIARDRSLVSHRVGPDRESQHRMGLVTLPVMCAWALPVPVRATACGEEP